MIISELLHWTATLCLILGGFFFVAGTLGLLRFPDVYSRLHAVTKADTLGLGLVVLGLSLTADSSKGIIMMLAVWLLVMASSTIACQLLARYQRERDQEDDDARS